VTGGGINLIEIQPTVIERKGQKLIYRYKALKVGRDKNRGREAQRKITGGNGTIICQSESRGTRRPWKSSKSLAEKTRS
ncbi:hypothetical protein HAX54_029636, partial [Datura stramonium]|nr:hypothetical protein [Datura stramonium]